MRRATFLLLASLCLSPAFAQDPTGTWPVVGSSSDGQPYHGTVRIRADGDRLVLSSTLRGAYPRAELRAPRAPEADGSWRFATERWARVTATRLNLRSGPGYWNPAIDQAVRGERLLVLGPEASNRYRPLQTESGLRVWAHGAFLDLSQEPAVRVTARSLNLRAGPGTSHRVLAVGRRGERLLDLGGRDGNYWELRTSTGLRVWAHGGYLEPITDVDDVLELRWQGDALQGVWFREDLEHGREQLGGPAREMVFVAMGDYAHDEAYDLQTRGVAVRAVLDNPAGDDVVRVDGVDYALNEDAGLDGFLHALQIPADRLQAARDVLEGEDDDARDELGQLLMLFWEADQGEREIERLVVSGHSVGSGVWGESNGYLAFRSIKTLCELFPVAAAQVEDWMIAGCYSNSPRKVAEFRGYFPNLKTIWAYGDSAPGSWSGAMIHNAIWEQATRGDEAALVTRDLAFGTRKGENVATWNSVLGYMGDEVRDLDEVRADLLAMEADYQGYFTGETVVEDTQEGPHRDYYRLVQEVLGDPSVNGVERERFEALRDQVIRVIFFEATIRGRFTEAHGDAVTAGYTALGLTAPDFSTLSRKDALAQIEAFEDALDASAAPPPEASAVWPLLEGLRELTPDVIPHTWV